MWVAFPLRNIKQNNIEHIMMQIENMMNRSVKRKEEKTLIKSPKILWLAAGFEASNCLLIKRKIIENPRRAPDAINNLEDDETEGSFTAAVSFLRSARADIFYLVGFAWLILSFCFGLHLLVIHNVVIQRFNFHTFARQHWATFSSKTGPVSLLDIEQRTDNHETF